MAGMKVNWQKTKIMVKNMEKAKIQDLTENMKFQQERRVKYLGIQRINKCSTLMEDNYMKLFQEIQRFRKIGQAAIVIDGRSCSN